MLADYAMLLPFQYPIANEHATICQQLRFAALHLGQTTYLPLVLNFDAHHDEIEGILRGVYGNDTPLWMRRWRWFFLATSGLFGYAEGSEWGVSHYRMKAAT